MDDRLILSIRIVVLIMFTWLLSACIRHEGDVWIESTPPPPPSTLPEAIEALHSDSAEERINAASFIGELGEDGSSAVPDLLDTLYWPKNPNSQVQRAVVRALGKIGPQAQDAVPALSELITSPSTSVHVRRGAARALCKIGDESAIIVLSEMLYDDESDSLTAAAAARAIACLAPDEFDIVSDIDNTRVEDGELVIVTEVKRWWEETGSSIDWQNFSQADD
jgi:HEAT repeat protein